MNQSHLVLIKPSTWFQCLHSLLQKAESSAWRAAERAQWQWRRQTACPLILWLAPALCRSPLKTKHKQRTSRESYNIIIKDEVMFRTDEGFSGYTPVRFKVTVFCMFKESEGHCATLLWGVAVNEKMLQIKTFETVKHKTSPFNHVFFIISIFEEGNFQQTILSNFVSLKFDKSPENNLPRPFVEPSMYLQGDMQNSKGMGCCYKPGRGISALFEVIFFNHSRISLIPESIVREKTSHFKRLLRIS